MSDTVPLFNFMVEGLFVSVLLPKVPTHGNVCIIGGSVESDGRTDINFVRVDGAADAVKFRNRFFDLIYIDVECPVDDYLVILDAWFPKLMRTGTIAGSHVRSCLNAVDAFMSSIWRPYTLDDFHWISYAPVVKRSSIKQRNGLHCSFVVPTYNNVRYTAQLFASLARTTGNLRYEIICIDNGSTDETVSFVGSHTPGQLRGRAQGDNPPKQVKLLHNIHPRHLALSWNMGYDAADGEYVFILNNDIIFTPGAIESMIRVAEDDQVGIVMPVAPMDVHGKTPAVVNPYKVANWINQVVENLALVENWQHNLTDNVTFLPDNYLPQGGYCFLLTRRCCERVGRFDEDYHLTGEDWDYFARTRRYFKIARPNNAYVEHFEHQTCRPLGLEFHERLCANRFLLTEKIEGRQHLFSVIIPVYNRSDALKAAIDSVIAQDFPHWRLYVIDDHSSPSEWAKIKSLSRQYETEAGRIWFFHQGENGGPGASRNYGLRLSQGKYVAFLDSDDIWYPNHLSRHYVAHESGDYAFVYSTPDFAYRWWQPSANAFLHQVDKHPTIDYFGHFDRDLFMQKMYVQTSSVSCWGELARQYEFPENIRLAEDWEYLKRLIAEGRTALHLQEKTCRYHIARTPHEAEHLVKAALPGLSLDPDAPRVIPLVLRQSVSESPVTVIIPTRNRNAQAAVALDSIRGLPCIVIDDGGSSPVELTAIVNKHPNAQLFRVPKSVGQSHVRNIAAEIAKSEWLQFLDDDDILTADYLTAIVEAIRHDVEMVTFSAYVPGANGMDVDQNVYTSQFCIKRSKFFEVGGFDKHCSWAEERDLLARLERIATRHLNLSAPLCVRPRRGGSGNPASRTGNIPAASMISVNKPRSHRF